jgi:hypothetical protein
MSNNIVPTLLVIGPPKSGKTYAVTQELARLRAEYKKAPIIWIAPAKPDEVPVIDNCTIISTAGLTWAEFSMRVNKAIKGASEEALVVVDDTNLLMGMALVSAGGANMVNAAQQTWAKAANEMFTLWQDIKAYSRAMLLTVGTAIDDNGNLQIGLSPMAKSYALAMASRVWYVDVDFDDERGLVYMIEEQSAAAARLRMVTPIDITA